MNFHNENLHLVFAVFSFVCFCIGASNFVGGENRVRIVSVGLAFVAATLIF